VRAIKKLRHLKDAPRLIPPVSFTVKDKKRYRGPRSQTIKDGIAQRTAMRRLLTKKLALITPDMIDEKSAAFQNYKQVVKGVTSDLGNRLSTVEQVLVNAFGAATVLLADLTARQLLGDQSVLQQKGFSQTVTALVRLSERLGVRHRGKDLPSLGAYLSKKSNGGGDTIEGEIVDHD
jgi:hypothetical protein